MPEENHQRFENVYVATVMPSGDVFLQSRNYEIIAKIPAGKDNGGFNPMLVDGACVCQISSTMAPRPGGEQGGIGFWFCDSEKTTADVSYDSIEGVTQVVMHGDCDPRKDTRKDYRGNLSELNEPQRAADVARVAALAKHLRT